MTEHPKPEDENTISISAVLIFMSTVSVIICCWMLIKDHYADSYYSSDLPQTVPYILIISAAIGIGVALMNICQKLKNISIALNKPDVVEKKPNPFKDEDGNCISVIEDQK